MANNNINNSNPFEDIEVLKALLYLQQQQKLQQKEAKQNKKVLSVEEYAKQAVNELLTKVGISYDSET